MDGLNASTNGTSDKSNEFRVALFGPQVTEWTYDSLSNLQSTLLANTKLAFLRQALMTLPSLWPILEKDDSNYGLLSQEKLEELRDFATGARKLDPQGLTNTHLSTLTIVIQFVNLLESTNISGNKHDILRFEAAQGFCVGFLSAAALASAHDWTNVEMNFSNAVRLAACIGITIDAESELRPDHERVIAIHVRWKTPEDRAYFETCLDQLSGAYVSCITDDRNITITLPSNSQAEFCLRMREAKIAATPVGLSGCYHHSSNAKVAEKLSQLCAENWETRLPDAEKLRLPLRSTSDANLINRGALHDIAIQTILCKRAHWFQTVKSTFEDAPQSQVSLVPFGNESCVPRSLSERNRLTFAQDRDRRISLEEIAIIGMACRYPKANNLEEFRQLLWAGESAVGIMPLERFNPAELDRQPELRNFWGNFLHNPDAFDHRFFNISGREANFMDPQQRLAMQVAYEALESSGYFSTAPVNGADVGCYLGVGSVDYDDNIASHDANAFAATGTLRAFISGRISHFFGWSGPSLTLDTACSSSAVAIHTASKALLGGECSMALAGGVNIITSPNLHQNLSAASFLNPNGASRAFDAEANGYCRGEGAGILVLKTLSKAKADGDSILGIVAASAVNQGTNTTNITVPDPVSQSSLYDKVLSAARIEPMEVTYVEAHGTGTLVGDPIEYESIRSALAGPWRRDRVFLGSVKDNIGHTEAASGVTSVIKALLMMQYKTIPKQANFKSLNPRIKASASLVVPQTTRSWTAQRRIALVNNYGAAGSNAALVLRDYPSTSSIITGRGIQATPPLFTCISPILLSARTANDLQSYVNVLKSYLSTLQIPVESIAYNIARSHNSSFKHRAAFVAADVQGVISGLDSSYTETGKNATSSPKRPVVLCFGGQGGRKIKVSKDLYERCDIFRTYLDECDFACQTLDLPSLYPDIFLDDDIEDIVSLHCMLLSLQIACAKCWIDCGLKVDTMVGHSFGQLTALCIADCFSLKDAFYFISSRARLIQDSWGPECGTMLSVECDKGELEAVVRLVNSTSDLRLDVACYNGPRNFVLAGDEPSIEKAEKECRSFKTTRLQSSHAYHSHLSHKILDPLLEVAKRITIRPPRIHIETCSTGSNWSQFTAENLVQHTREPVHFADAVERIASRLPSAIWLEAGSTSPVISMTRRTLASKSGRMDTFFPIEIGNADAPTHLAKIACQLWMAGSAAKHWLFHGASQYQYTKLNLPPYQFDKSSHWVQYKPKSRPKIKEASDLVNALVNDSAPAGEYLFEVHTANPEFDLAARGHAVAGQSLCPASMYIELAARCVVDLQRTRDTSKCHILPYVESLIMSAPLGLGKGTTVFLRLKEIKPTVWQFAVISRLLPTGTSKRIVREEIEHARGRISSVGGSEIQTQRSLKLLQRSSVYHAQNSASAAGVNGSMVYKTFSDVVEYASYYRGVQSVSAQGTEAIGLVSTSLDKDSSFGASVCDFISLDNFLQVAGIHVNCLSSRKKDQVFICTEVEEIIFSSSFMMNRNASRAWTVHNRYKQKPLSEVINNIMVCDSLSGDLVLAIMGAKFKSVPFKSVARSLAGLNRGSTNSGIISQGNSDDSDDLHDSAYQTGAPSPPDDWPEPEVSMHTFNSLTREIAPKLHTPQTISIEPQQESQQTALSALIPLLCNMFSDILEVPVREIKPMATLNDLGIDSLLVTEVLSEIETRFSVSLERAQIMACSNLTSVAGLIQETRTPSKYKEPVEGTHQSRDHLTNGDRLINRQNPTNRNRLTNGQSATDGIDLIKANDISADDSLPNKDAYTNSNKFMDSYSSEVLEEESQPIFGNYHADRLSPVTNTNLAIVCCDYFVDINALYEQCAALTGFAGFCGDAFSLQSKLVVQYVVEGFAVLGCPLRALKCGDEVPAIRFEARHKKLVHQLYKILRDADLMTEGSGGRFLRTKKPISTIPSSILFDEMLKTFPKHSSETRLLHTTAHRLADCLSGVADPLALLFHDAKARTLLEDVYTNAPMFKTGTLVLAQYLFKVLTRVGASRELKILELGAGTGGTSKQLIETLVKLGPGYKFSYTFTDLSPSLVAAARRKFSKWSFMQYTVLDIENEPDLQFMNAYDIIISTNCIHATKSLVQSCTNIRKMLRADGVLCLVELTRNLYWFDLVFGLLEGWWLFDDGREHALADEQRWERCLIASGFEWIGWTSSPTTESNILRVITASPYSSAPLDKDVGLRPDETSQRSSSSSSDNCILKETVTFKEFDGLSLLADIYYPSKVVESKEKLPVALMIHGGGHIMLSRNDVRPEQTKKLLQSGFIPISIDYRLCPEITLLEGPMTDVADALLWIRSILPNLILSRRDIRIDPHKVVAVGWSTGGHLAMTLAWTSAARQIQPPEAILAFYCPTDYEDPFWTTPNIPIGAPQTTDINMRARISPSDYEKKTIYEGVFDEPILAYNISPKRYALGGWLAPSDARSRLAIYMNTHGRTLHVLLGECSALNSSSKSRKQSLIDDQQKQVLPPERIIAASPLAQIRAGNYAAVPTFLIHPRKDDLIPWQQAERTWQALKNRGVADAELRIVEDVPHLFDVYPQHYRVDQAAVDAIEEGYRFLCKYVEVE